MPEGPHGRACVIRLSSRARWPSGVSARSACLANVKATLGGGKRRAASRVHTRTHARIAAAVQVGETAGQAAARISLGGHTNLETRGGLLPGSLSCRGQFASRPPDVYAIWRGSAYAPLSRALPTASSSFLRRGAGVIVFRVSDTAAVFPLRF